MFDCHYDLLTYIYMNRNHLSEIKKYSNKIFKNNITGGVFNLFYMSPKEMKDELNIEYKEINIIENLRTVKNLIKLNELIPTNVKYIYGIEGLDYLDNLDDIDVIYSMGVRSINPVWNNDNKFGGGVKGNKNRGLTTLGEKLIKKLVSKNIAIDLSHSNDKTFYNIIEVCKDLKIKNQNPIIIASHSNVRNLCDVSRNLSDDQIINIKELDGVIGIVGVKQFCIKERKFNNNRWKYYNAYVNHIKYVRNLLEGVENITVSTDDMTYYNNLYYKHFNVFKQTEIKKELENELLKNKFSKNEIEKIMYMNFRNKILDRV